MEKWFLNAEQYKNLQDSYPILFENVHRKQLIDALKHNNRRLMSWIPKAVLKEDDYFWDENRVLFKHTRYIWKAVLKILKLQWTEVDIQENIWLLVLTEISKQWYSSEIWRSCDSKYVYEYNLMTHWDTIISNYDTEQSTEWHLSFHQDISPLIETFMHYIKAIDVNLDNTLKKWNWEEVFLDCRWNPWKWNSGIPPYWHESLCKWILYSLGSKIPANVAEIDPESIGFSLSNRRQCFPVIENWSLCFYIEDKQWDVEIWRYGKFSRQFIINREDMEKMFLAMCKYIARSSIDLPKLICKHFPEYYKSIWK
ncbi:MAG: hypothetical protein ACD_3C00086G0009 [uncultured bacterium (gcode 4)]|uniref:Uncharacterized protein n=1 Tax=uncultured bacterium (gcode 4) TaxID=1234023 RepID=K2GXN5_9BACT|nr:MAG: hypothetical protein ACD_3C00086G0009 [uncultured bacterium (gcode 4)]